MGLLVFKVSASTSFSRAISSAASLAVNTEILSEIQTTTFSLVLGYRGVDGKTSLFVNF
jgi:hypothetical protein